MKDEEFSDGKKKDQIEDQTKGSDFKKEEQQVPTPKRRPRRGIRHGPGFA